MKYGYLTAAELSDIGRQRSRNEDATLMLTEHGVFAAFDGMGGASGGGEASKTACEALRRKFATNAAQPTGLASLKGKVMMVRSALNEASREIRERADAQGVSGTGTTAVVLIFDEAQPQRAIILHAGDSRAYRYRDDQMVQLTRDHSFAVAAGVASERSLPPMFRGVVTRAVGLERDVVLEETLVDVAKGDTFMLCTDGLTKMVADAAISQVFRRVSQTALSTLTAILVEEANNAGGQDNTSVILIGVTGFVPAASSTHGGQAQTSGTTALPPLTKLSAEPETEIETPAGRPAPTPVVASATPAAGGGNGLLALAAGAAVTVATVAGVYWLSHGSQPAPATASKSTSPASVKATTPNVAAVPTPPPAPAPVVLPPPAPTSAPAVVVAPPVVTTPPPVVAVAPPVVSNPPPKPVVAVVSPPVVPPAPAVAVTSAPVVAVATSNAPPVAIAPSNPPKPVVVAVVTPAPAPVPVPAPAPAPTPAPVPVVAVHPVAPVVSNATPTPVVAVVKPVTAPVVTPVHAPAPAPVPVVPPPAPGITIVATSVTTSKPAVVVVPPTPPALMVTTTPTVAIAPAPAVAPVVAPVVTPVAPPPAPVVTRSNVVVVSPRGPVVAPPTTATPPVVSPAVAPVAPVVVAAPVVPKRSPEAAAAAQAMMEMLMVDVVSALADGHWSLVEETIQEWAPSAPQEASALTDWTVFRGWSAVWREASTGQIPPADLYLPYRQKVSASLTEMGSKTDGLPSPVWGVDARRNADQLCRARFRAQNELIETVRRRGEEAAQISRLLRDGQLLGVAQRIRRNIRSNQTDLATLGSDLEARAAGLVAAMRDARGNPAPLSTDDLARTFAGWTGLRVAEEGLWFALVDVIRDADVRSLADSRTRKELNALREQILDGRKATSDWSAWLAGQGPTDVLKFLMQVRRATAE